LLKALIQKIKMTFKTAGSANRSELHQSGSKLQRNRGHVSKPAPKPVSERSHSTETPNAVRASRAKPSSSVEGRLEKPLAVEGGSDRPPWDLSAFDVKPIAGKVRFHDFDLPLQVMHAIADLGYQYCTPIQAEILPSALAGQDASGRAQTGTGKTAAFLVAILTRLIRSPLKGKRLSGTPRVLILAPTRELVLQIADEAQAMARYLDLSIVTVFGGMDYEKQKRQLHGPPVDIVVATPGRLLDFQRHKDLSLNRVEILIIDEADRMLDMGFIPDVRQIVYSTPPKAKRQTLLFSATLTPEITHLASQWTHQQIVVEIEPEKVAVETVDQKVYIVTTDQKYALLYNIITRQDLNRVIVFCNRRDETRRLVDLLRRYRINCNLLSGEVSQQQRIKRLEDFRDGRIRVLVATDVAGRGIHIEKMSHVINYTLPHDPEDYVHRIGRTGRAGLAGTSISFACEDDSFYIPPIEAYIGQKLACTQPDETWLHLPDAPQESDRRQRRKPARSKSGRARSSGSPGPKRKVRKRTAKK
jgi:ATP-dependent RNA helicase RhlB